ncbi:MAG TPA: OmpA family protein [Usitatibacteraceae bacterium]|nr:OmpA family protein [Usitatibacteraceae bacterium]
MTRLQSFAFACIALGLSACAAKTERVILLPETGARPTSIELRRSAEPGKPVVLAEPYAEAKISKAGVETGKTSADAVAAQFGGLLTATPAAPRRYQLYFSSGSEDLLPESLRTFDAVLKDAAASASNEVIVIGHTDRVGTVESNDALSLKRAQVIRERLIGAGVPAARVEASGRGEREPMINTADEVAEPRNRRVEIKVR